MHSSVELTRWKLSIHGLWEQSTFAHKHKYLTRNGDGRWQDCPHRSRGNARPPAKLYRPPFDSRWCPCRWRLAKKLTNDSRFKICALYEAFLVRSGQPFQESQALCCSRFLCSPRSQPNFGRSAFLSANAMSMKFWQADNYSKFWLNRG